MLRFQARLRHFGILEGKMQQMNQEQPHSHEAHCRASRGSVLSRAPKATMAYLEGFRSTRVTCATEIVVKELSLTGRCLPEVDDGVSAP